MQASIWEKETFFAPQDIVIVGSGLVGLWSAWYLRKKYRKARITILERGPIPTGASTRNAGFACFGSLTELLADEQRVGTDSMLELVEMRFRGLERIRKTFGEKALEFDMTGGYELFLDRDDCLKEDLQDQIDYLNELLEPIVKSKRSYKLADKKRDSFGFGNTQHLVRNHLEGYLHSGKLVQGMIRELTAQGVQFLNNTALLSFDQGPDGIILKTNQYFELRTAQLLFCTNGFARELLPDLDIGPARGQVLVTSPITPLPWKGTFHYDKGFYYFRNLGDRVLLGGARNRFIEEETTPSMDTSTPVQEALEQFLADVILPGRSYQIEHRWSGIMGMGSEKFPIVRNLGSGLHCAVRLSGMGVALAPVIGERVANDM